MGYFHYIALALAALPFNQLDPSLINPQQHVSVEGLHPTKQLNPYLPKKDFWNTDYGKAVLSEGTYAPRRYLHKGNVIQDKNIHEEEIVEDEDEDEDIQDEDDEDDELERNPEDFDEDGFQNDGDDQDDSLNQRVSHRRILKVKLKGGKSGGGDGSSGGGKKGGSSGGSKVAGSGGKGSRTNQPGYRALPDLRGYDRVPKTVKGTNDKSFWGKKLRGSSYSRSGCGYSGMPCSSFVYPYRSYSASTYSYHSSYRYYYPYYYPYYGYHRPSYYKGPGDDLTDYQWNILSTLPYIAKSPLFGKRNVHGKPFDDVEDAPQITTGKVKMVTIYGTTRVTSISFQFFGDRSLSHGTQQNGETSVQLALDEDEDLVEGSFSNCKVNGHTRLCGATFTTTKGKTISHGRFGKIVHQTVSPKGFSIGGFFGRQGKNFDYLGLVAINFDVMNSFSEQYSIAEFDGSTWYNTQFPGIAASYVVGGNNGYYYNMGLLLPYSIYEMRINKVSMYGKKKLAGMSFAYDDGSIIDIGTVKDEGDPTIVDLGTTGRINQITITQYRAKKTVCNEYVCSTKKRRRIAGAQFQFTDKDGKNQSASGGDVDLNKLQNDVFDIPDGTDVVATVGSQGSRLDNIGFLIRKSKTAKELASAPLPSP